MDCMSHTCRTRTACVSRVKKAEGVKTEIWMKENLLIWKHFPLVQGLLPCKEHGKTCKGAARTGLRSLGKATGYIE